MAAQGVRLSMPDGTELIERAAHLNVRHLEIFWATMRSGNQHEAARSLGLSQPAVSKVLKYLEDRIGVLLFRRVKGRLQPTMEGQAFFRAVDDIFSRLDVAERLARDLQRRLSGQITLATTSAFATSLIPHALGAFLRAHPLMRAGLKILTPAEVVSRVASGEAELGLTFGPIDTAPVHTYEICRVPIICAVPAGHRLAGRQKLTAADLDGERLITAAERPLWGRIIGDTFSAAGKFPVLAVECTQPDVAIALAEQQLGVAVVPSVPLRADTVTAASLCEFEPKQFIPVLAVTSEGRPTSQALATMIDQLRVSAQLESWPGCATEKANRSLDKSSWP